MTLLDRLLGVDRFTTERALTLCRDLPDGDSQEREHLIGCI